MEIRKHNFVREKLGESTRIKILEFLINNKENSFGLKEIILHAQVKHRTAVKELQDLLKKDMIYIERTLGKSHLYKINEFEPFIQSLIFSMDITKESSPIQKGKEAIKRLRERSF